ncbi:MAG: selenide, water dikinase SelD [Carnobacterium sp.]
MAKRKRAKLKMENQWMDGLFICGGCNAKIGPGDLSDILAGLPKQKDGNLLVGFDSADDAAVYQLNEDLAMIQTMDFFPAMVSDPRLFGQIAAANAMSDVFAMGGEVMTAMNMVCWPEEQPLEILAEILAGGQEKVQEAGGILVGGHSIHDSLPKYGLSVSGKVHPNKIYRNDTCKLGDCLILTKPLGTGIITTAYSAGEMGEEEFQAAAASMTMLNVYASTIMEKYTVHSCTDITGFGLLGHLNEMLTERFSCVLESSAIPVLKGAYEGAKEFLVTAGGQRNRNALSSDVSFEFNDYALEEVLFDPQTSGGLLVSVPKEEANELLLELQAKGLTSGIIGVITARSEYKMTVY